MKTCYYYQTFTSLQPIIDNPNSTDVVIVSSLHFGEDNTSKKAYIHLNNNHPDSSIFNKMWEEVSTISDKKTIMVMLGGAGGAYEFFFNNFDECYSLLVSFLKNKNFIKGIDLDIEESVDIKNVQKLISKLVSDFGSKFIITMAPLGSSLQNDSPGMGNFSYKELYQSKEGDYIHWFNAQCYGGSFSYSTFDKIVRNGYPANKVVMGMMSGDFPSTSFSKALDEVSQIKKKYPEIGGVFDWEYLDAPPDSTNPSIWGQYMKEKTN